MTRPITIPRRSGPGGSSSNMGGNGVTSEEEQNNNNLDSVRSIHGFVERFDREEIQEILSQISCHWLLSLEDFKFPIENPVGLVSQMAPSNDDHIFVMVPYDPSIEHLDYREFHQILRELTIGVYGLNQHPCLNLETNFDESTTCQLPPAYIDTRLGQIMINADYWLKSLWHGAYFPRDKRIKFAERWDQILDVDAHGVAQTKKSVITEFLKSGLTDISKDPEYAEAFASVLPDTSLKTFGLDLGSSYKTKRKSLASNDQAPADLDPNNDLMEFTEWTDKQIQEEMSFFMSYIDDLQLKITFGLNDLKQYGNVYEIDPTYSISSCCRASNDRIDNAKFERLKKILNVHEKFLRQNYARKKEIKKYLNMLKIVGFLVPLFVGLKKRMRIPDLNHLLAVITGDDVHTERKLPPLMLDADFKCKNLMFPPDKYFNLHGGIQFEMETCPLDQVEDVSLELDEEYKKIKAKATDILRHYTQLDQQQEYQIPVFEFKNKKYWCIRIDLEAYYPQQPQKPPWIAKLQEDLIKLKPKRIPMTDLQVYDIFKRQCGYKRATKFKSLPAGLKASAQRGIIGIFQYFLRKSQANNLAKHDESGLGLMHYAAIHNKPLIISNLIMNAIDANIKQQIDYMAIGPMPIHYASRCGSLDALSCLISNYANVSFADHEGWAPIHHAAYFDNVDAIRLFARKQHELIDLTTRSESRRTPILLAASSGALQAVKCLIALGANIAFLDEGNYNLINIAAHKSHTNVLEYFIHNKYPQLDTWKILIDMLDKAIDDDKEASSKCLNILTNQNKSIWPSILKSGGIEKLCAILRKYANQLTAPPSEDSTAAPAAGAVSKPVKPAAPVPARGLVKTKSNVKFELPEKAPVNQQVQITLNALSVLCNLSEETEIKQRLCGIKDLSSILIKILELSPSEDVQSRVAILLGDMASLDESTKISFAEKNCLEKLMVLLHSDLEDLLVNAVNAIEIICKNNPKNQSYCCDHGIFEIFTSLMHLNSDLLRSSVAAAISSITHNNYEIQLHALKKDVVGPLVNLLKSRNMTVQLKVALALESLALNNQKVQKAIIDLDAPIYMIRLLEIKANMEDWSIIIREQAAITLWALAGDQKPQRKAIAEQIGISQIISMLLSKSEKLQYVGCRCMIALVLENVNNQNKILQESGIDPLIRLLKSEKTSHRVIAAAVDTIGALCVDIAHVNNELTQTELIDKGALELLTELMEKPFNKEIQINTAHALSCLLLNQSDEKLVDTHYTLNLQSMLTLIETDDLNQRLQAGLAITVLAYNNSSKQYAIKQLGGISFRSYEVFFDQEKCTQMQLCEACFQIVVLARIINDRDQVWLTALGITKLSGLLLSNEDQVIIQSASYMSSLAHTRAGITDAMITCDAVDILCDLLYSHNEQIRFASAVTLGYLTFNRTASRLLLHNCRNVPTLFNTLTSLLQPETKISPQFIESFHTALKLGLPKLLVNNKCKFYDEAKRAEREAQNQAAAKPSFYNPQEKITACLERNRTQLVINLNRSQSAPMSKVFKARPPPSANMYKLTAKDREASHHTDTEDEADEKSKSTLQTAAQASRQPQERPATMTRPSPQIVSISRPTMGARPMTQINIKRATNVKY